MKTLFRNCGVIVAALFCAGIFVNQGAYAQYDDPYGNEYGGAGWAVEQVNAGADIGSYAPVPVNYQDTFYTPSTVDMPINVAPYETSAIGISYSQPVNNYVTPEIGVSYAPTPIDIGTENSFFTSGVGIGIGSANIETPSIPNIASIDTGSYGASNMVSVTAPEIPSIDSSLFQPVDISYDAAPIAAENNFLASGVTAGVDIPRIEAPSFSPVAMEVPYRPEAVSVDTGYSVDSAAVVSAYPMMQSISFDQGFVPVAKPENPNS